MSKSTLMISGMAMTLSVSFLIGSWGDLERQEELDKRDILSRFPGGFEEAAYYYNPLPDPNAACCSLTYEEARKQPGFSVEYPKHIQRLME